MPYRNIDDGIGIYLCQAREPAKKPESRDGLFQRKAISLPIPFACIGAMHTASREG